eukprot:TRINITY_DN26031_c0_g1_i1.p1 TRINITY_DN26031_c0_g1~~TRINITY_DN26031_c0_g1_i1.p1  ORF type:complete len:489 (+),score=115.32 TRINITY_DN26031_c0_g1_i1:131-1597(+)
MIRRPPRSTLSSSSAASDVYKRQETMDGLLAAHEGEDSQAVRDIELDVQRTFPDKPQFQTEHMQQRLRRVLQAYAFSNPETGYAQGLNFMAGFLLAKGFETDQAVFELLSTILNYVVPRYHTPNLEGILVDQAVLEELIRLHSPQCYQHMARLDLSIQLLSAQWFACLLIGSVPDDVADLVWTRVLVGGRKIWLFVLVSLMDSLTLTFSECSDLSEAIVRTKALTTGMALPEMARIVAKAEGHFERRVSMSSLLGLIEMKEAQIRDQQLELSQHRQMMRLGSSEGFSRSEVEQLRAALTSRFGTGVDGITEVQWTEMLEVRFPGLVSDAARLFQVLDCDGDGKLTLKELFHALWILHHGTVREKIALIFTEYDSDGNGKLERHELQAMVTISRRLTLSPGEDGGSSVDAILAHLDADGDGSLSLDQFSLGVRTFPALAELLARYQDQEMVQLKRATQGLDVESEVKAESKASVRSRKDESECVCCHVS